MKAAARAANAAIQHVKQFALSNGEKASRFELFRSDTQNIVGFSTATCPLQTSYQSHDDNCMPGISLHRIVMTAFAGRDTTSALGSNRWKVRVDPGRQNLTTRSSREE